jgi:hypothetical protein
MPEKELFCSQIAKIASGWGIRPQTSLPPAAGGFSPDPQPPAAGSYAPRPPLDSAAGGLRPRTSGLPPPNRNSWLRQCAADYVCSVR